MLKRYLLAGAAFTAPALFAASAFAADMPVTPAPMAPAPMAPAPIFFDWTGVYAGLHAGYAWGDRDLTVHDVPPAFSTFSYDSDGWLLGGQIGANWQVDQFVFGVEGDLAWSGVDGSMTIGTPILPPGLNAGETHDMKWLGTVRARLGVAFDAFMLYGTGGVAFAKYNSTATFSGSGIPTFVASDSNTHTGWTIGAGVEAGLTPNLSLKAEYLYVDLGSKNYNYAFAAPIGPVTVNADHQHHIIRAGLNWRFGGLFGAAY